MNAFTTKEYTAFYVRLLADDHELGLDILSDIIWSPAFRPDEFESERQVILEEILMHADEPADLVHDVLAGALFPEHPLGREVLGEQVTVDAMSVADVAAFHAAHYRPGQYRCRRRRAARPRPGRRGAGRSTLGRRRVARPRPDSGPSLPPLSRVVLSRPTEQVHLAVAAPAPDRDDDDRHAMSIVEHVLGGGMSSRLFQSIREERGLAYSVYSYRLAFEGAGALAVYAGTAPVERHRGPRSDRLRARWPGLERPDRRRAGEGPGPHPGLHGARARGHRRPHEPSRPQPDRAWPGPDPRRTRRPAARPSTWTRSTRWRSRWLSGPRTLACVGPFDPDGVEGPR